MLLYISTTSTQGSPAAPVRPAGGGGAAQSAFRSSSTMHRAIAFVVASRIRSRAPRHIRCRNCEQGTNILHAAAGETSPDKVCLLRADKVKRFNGIGLMVSMRRDSDDRWGKGE